MVQSSNAGAERDRLARAGDDGAGGYGIPTNLSLLRRAILAPIAPVKTRGRLGVLVHGVTTLVPLGQSF